MSAVADQEKHYNAAGTHVRVYNPETDGHWDCPEGYLEVALARGFELDGPLPEVDLTGLFDEAPLFDPAEHGVKEVSEHLAAHAETDPGEVERVLGLERSGKNRKSIAVPDGFDPITGD